MCLQLWPTGQEQCPSTGNQCAAGSGLVLDHHHIGFGPAARNLAVEPAVRAETDRTHHAAPEIIQPSQVSVFPDHVLYVVRFEGRQGRSVRLPCPESAAGTSAVPGRRVDRQRPVRDCDGPCAAGSRRASPVSRRACFTSIPVPVGRQYRSRDWIVERQVVRERSRCLYPDPAESRMPWLFCLRLPRRRIQCRTLSAPVTPDHPASSPWRADFAHRRGQRRPLDILRSRRRSRISWPAPVPHRLE